MFDDHPCMGNSIAIYTELKLCALHLTSSLQQNSHCRKRAVIFRLSVVDLKTWCERCLGLEKIRLRLCLLEIGSLRH
jgi:hypothetical protein